MSIVKNAIFEFDNIDCEIYLIDESGEYMMQSAAFINEKLGLIKKLKPIKIKVGEGLVGNVASTKSGKIISTFNHPAYIINGVERLSEIAVPIIYNNNVLGVIYAVHSESNFFPETHLELYQTVAAMTATKLIQTKDYERLVQSKEKLKENQTKLIASQKISKLGHYEFYFSTNLWESSKSLDEILGFDKSYIKNNKGYLDFICYDNLDDIRTYFNQLIRSRSKKFYKEHRVINVKTKKIKWVINKEFLFIMKIIFLLKYLEQFKTLPNVKLQKKSS